MTYKVCTIERSPLARNIYKLLLNQLNNIEMTECDLLSSKDEWQESIKEADLVILSGSTIVDRKEDILKLVKGSSPDIVLIIREGADESWRDFARLKRLKILKKPFESGEFLDCVKKLKGLRK